MFVTTLFVIDSSEVTVTCGYSQSKVQLSNKRRLTTSENPTVPEASTSDAFSKYVCV